MGKKHSIIAPSGAARWLKCNPSARLEEKVPNIDTKFTNEGTTAHRLAAYYLEKRNGANNTPEKDKELAAELKDIKKDEFYNREMETYIKTYLKYVSDFYFNGETVETFTEKEFSLKFLCPELSDELQEPCTVDRGHITNGEGGDYRLDIIDLKYGRNVKVFAKDNPQLKLYALAVLDNYDLDYDIDCIVLHIVQPRLNHTDRVVMSREELEEWKVKEVIPAVKNVIQGTGELETGVHCKYCRVLKNCPTVSTRVMNLPVNEKPRTMSLNTLSSALTVIPIIRKWCDEVEEESKNRAKNGNKIPGYKMVKGKRKRVLDPDKLNDLIGELELYERSECYHPEKLKSMTDLEKVLGFTEDGKPLINDFVIWQDNPPQLVPENDPREEIKTGAAADFMDDLPL